ncbi:hypothetical protein DFH06DRAFT_433395 [Mycena polygramma]|nr:hypothetical protein DFH06DRAFT_433395 [Mycena polygramma]
MSSPFSSKLGTNYCPKDAEVAQINELLIEPCQRLKRLDDELAIMQKAIDKLVEERDKLNSYVEAHRALVSPIRRLPLDVIAEIFMACLPTNRNCVMSAEEAPVLLGRICSSWRAISFSIPRLWAKLHIVEPSLSHNGALDILQPKFAQRVEVATAWLNRSGACPLFISLEGPVDRHLIPPSDRNADPFPDVLLSFASRWQAIRLVAPPSTIEAILSRVTENDVPLLRSLDIIEPPGYQRSEDGTQWGLSKSGVSRGPSLSSFSIEGYGSNPLDLPLRWAQLTVLSLMHPTWLGGAEALEILSRCSKLQSCKLSLRGPADPSAEGLLTNSRVECPFLLTLELECVLITPGVVFRPLSLPSLQNLQLDGAVDPHSELTTNFFASFLLSSTRLESITISPSLFSKSFLFEVLCGLPPTLGRLHLSEPVRFSMDSLDDDSMVALTSSPALLCPALQELVMAGCRKVSDDVLLRFVLSRVPILRLVEIRFDRLMQFNILPSLQPLVEAGLQTNISYICPPPAMFSPWQGLPDAPASYGIPAVLRFR